MARNANSKYKFIGVAQILPGHNSQNFYEQFKAYEAWNAFRSGGRPLIK